MADSSVAHADQPVATPRQSLGVSACRVAAGRLARPHALAALVFGLLLVLLGLRPINDPDVWHHLRTGEQVARERWVPTQDVFSHTLNGGRFLVDSWLANLGFYAVWSGFGMWGIRVVNAIGVAAVAGLLWWLVGTQQREGCYRLGAFVVCASLAVPFVTWRPQTFSILCLLALYPHLTAPTEIRLYGKRLLLIVAVMALWANLHPVVIAGAVLYWFALTGCVLARLLQPYLGVRFTPAASGADLRRAALVGLVIVAATFINANTYHIHEYAIHGTVISQQHALNIQEWASPIPRWRAWFGQRVLNFDLTGLGPNDLDMVMIIAALAATLFGWRHALLIRRDVHAPQFAFSAACLFLALRVVRCLWFLVFAVVYAASQLGPPTTRRRRIVAWTISLSLWITACLATSSRILATNVLSSRAEISVLPKSVCDFVNDAGLTGRLYNEYNWGGYLIYRLYPNCQVFIDGRNIDYHWNDPTIVTDYVESRRAGLEAFGRILDERKVDLIVIERQRFGRSPSHLTGTMKDTALAAARNDCLQAAPEGWVCVFVNREGAVFLRDEGNNPNMQRCEEHYATFGLSPTDWRPFRPTPLISKSRDFAVRYGLVDDSYFEALPRDDVPSYLLRAKSLATVMAVQSAAELYEQALTLDGGNRDALLGTARMYHFLDRVEPARERAARAYGFYPTDPEVRQVFHHMQAAH